MTRSRAACGPGGKWSRSGGNAFMKTGSLGWRITHARGVPGLFPPEVVVTVKALACELPARAQRPLACWSLSELAAETQRTGLVASISGSTIWRWLHDDAIRPWFHRSWIFPRDQAFATKAGRILDLYERVWEEHPLTAEEFVISADEKTSIQARRRHPTQPARAGAVMKVEHEYERAGAWAYLAALDVHQAQLFGRCEPTTGIAPFDRLVEQVMTIPLIATRGACSGSSTMARRTAVRAPCNACSGSIRISCTGPSMPVGSIKSRSTSRSCSARS